MAAANRGASVGRWITALRLFGAIVIALLTLAGTARAATIRVTTLVDDLTPNDGTVSLREAIEAINSGNSLGDPDIMGENPGAFGTNDTILFDIPAARPTIEIGSTGNGALPMLTKRVTINGYFEPGASTNTVANGDNANIEIALDGASAGPNADGILVGAGGAGSTIEGLDVFDFSLNQIELQGGGDIVAGNQIGFDNTGSPTHSPVGIRISSSSNSLIGGLTAAARNVISGNVGNGIDIAGSLSNPAKGNFVEGNFIGTDSTGLAADGNGRASVFAQAGAVQISGGDDNTIGGQLAQARNVISGNGAGVDIRNGGQYNVVQGNFIGTGADGVTAVPNINFGVRVASSDNLPSPLGPGQPNEPGSSGNVIGLNPNNSFTGSGNVIAHNGGDGVEIDESHLPNSATPIENSGNSISGNSIFGNGGQGIDLKGGSGHILPNNLMSAPAITAIAPASGATVIQGALSRPASPMMNVRVELFASAACGPAGSGQGQTLIGTTNITTNASGSANFNASVTPLAPGQVVTATATNLTADPSSQAGSVKVFNTSSFSSCVTVPPPPRSVTTPKVTNAAETHRSWREGNALASFSRKRRAPVGTTFTFTLNEQASVSFTFNLQLRGREAKGKCVAQTKRNRHRRSCVRTTAAGELTFIGQTGLNKVAFAGRLSASKRLKPGSYTVTITASSAGGSSTPDALSFTIVR